MAGAALRGVGPAAVPRLRAPLRAGDRAAPPRAVRGALVSPPGRALREGAGPLPSQDSGILDPYDAVLLHEVIDHLNVEIRVRAAEPLEDLASPSARVVIEGA